MWIKSCVNNLIMTSIPNGTHQTVQVDTHYQTDLTQSIRSFLKSCLVNMWV